MRHYLRYQRVEAREYQFPADVSAGAFGRIRLIYFRASRSTQIIRHAAKLPNHLGIAEIARGRITGTTERDRANMAFLTRKRLGAHHGCIKIKAFDRFASRAALLAISRVSFTE